MNTSPVEQIKERLNIVDYIGEHVRLVKAGTNYKAVCPFHSEKTPSFFVSPSRQIWHCFGCSLGGDIFKFVMEMDRIEFPEALRVLAERAGVELKREDPRLRSQRNRLYDVSEEAAKYYEKKLFTRKDVGEYLKKRGMEGATAKSFRIGYAPASWDGLLKHLTSLGFTNEEIIKAGLAIKSDKSQRFGCYDRFRGRIMFPLADSSGRVVGFSGRVFNASSESAVKEGGNPPSAKDMEEAPKYVNTPQTEIYDKSRILYGLDRAKTDIRKQNKCIVLEGQMDLIMSHQAGVKNAVAVSGTALTPLHITQLKRLSENIVMSFDMDDAGLSATEKSVALALDAGIDVEVISFPEAKDPADLIKEDKEQWAKLINNAKPVVEFLIDAMRRRTRDDREFKKEATKRVLPYLAKIENEIDRAHWVSYTAKAIQVGESAVFNEMDKIKPEPAKTESPNIRSKIPENDRNRKARLEERIIGFLLWKKDSLGDVIKKCRSEWFSAQRRDLLEGVIAGEEDNNHYPKKLAFEAELLYSSLDKPEDEFLLLIKDLHKEHVKNKLFQLTTEIRKFEIEGDKEALKEGVERFKKLSSELGSL